MQVASGHTCIWGSIYIQTVEYSLCHVCNKIFKDRGQRRESQSTPQNFILTLFDHQLIIKQTQNPKMYSYLIHAHQGVSNDVSNNQRGVFFYTIFRREMSRSELASAEQIAILARFPIKSVSASLLFIYILHVCASLFLFYLVCMLLTIWCSPLRTPLQLLDTHKDASTGLEQNEELNKCLGWGHRGMRQT